MKKNTILIIGSGAREHALGWKLKQSSKVGEIYFAPGTAGTESIGKSSGISILDHDALITFAIEKKIDLTVAGPDDALAAGIVNVFSKNKLRIFGPTKEAAQIESSKAFAKQLMKEENIPTAKYESFTNIVKAKKYINKQKLPVVIKASGLALGKGVIIAETHKEAEKILEDIMVKKIFGNSGETVIIEEFLTGKEISIHAFSDGKTISLFPTSRDHKPIYDGNKGPNTGGMGTITPLPDVSKKQLEEIRKTIVVPAIKGMKKRGIPFTGCLYPGLIMTKDGPKVIEFNCRFGDPEIESYLRILETDLFEILWACTEEKLSSVNIQWKNSAACCIILASADYPAGSHKGDIIYGLKPISPLIRGRTKEPACFDRGEDQEGFNNIVVFHYATKTEQGKPVTNSGRVLAVTAVGKTLEAALKIAYGAIGEQGIHFNGMQYRKDLGKM